MLSRNSRRGAFVVFILRGSLRLASEGKKVLGLEVVLSPPNSPFASKREEEEEEGAGATPKLGKEGRKEGALGVQVQGTAEDTIAYVPLGGWLLGKASWEATRR